MKEPTHQSGSIKFCLQPMTDEAWTFWLHRFDVFLDCSYSVEESSKLKPSERFEQIDLNIFLIPSLWLETVKDEIENAGLSGEFRINRNPVLDKRDN